MIAVLIGATGLVGSELLKLLCADESFEQVVVATRRELTFTHPKIKTVLFSDIADLKLKKDALAGECYFCCLGTTIKKAGSQERFRAVDYNGVIDFAEIARAHRAKSFVVISAMGADSKSKIFYNQVKGEMENALMALELTHLVIFRPGLLLGERGEFRPAESMAIGIAKGLRHFIPAKFIRRYCTQALVLAHHMVNESKEVREASHIIEASDIHAGDLGPNG